MPQRARRRGAPIRGELVRSLRRSRRWTQEEVAHRAGLSEKLVGKAERGEPIDLSSIAALAAAFASSDCRITPQEFIDTKAAGAGQAAGLSFLQTWLQRVWQEGDLAVVDEIVAEAPQFYCEAGCLTTRAAIKERVEQARRFYRPIGVEVDVSYASGALVDCRWRLLAGAGAAQEASGEAERLDLLVATSFRTESNRICEAWEFCDARTAFLLLADRGVDSAATSLS